MDHELIMPVELTEEDLADQIARAVWVALAGLRRAKTVTQDRFEEVRSGIRDHLRRAACGRRSLGTVAIFRFERDPQTMAGEFERNLTRTIAARAPELFPGGAQDTLLVRELPNAIRGVLERYLWIDGADVAPPYAASAQAVTANGNGLRHGA